MDKSLENAAAALKTAVQFIKGVGPDRAKVLDRLNLRTVRDLLFFFPREYADLSERRTVHQLQAGQSASVVAEVEDFELRTSAQGKSIFGVLFRQQNEWFRGVWFNQPFMADRFRRGQRVMVSGAPKLNGLRWQFVHPRVTPLDQAENQPGEILPVYPLTEGLKQHHLRKIIGNALDEYASCVPEVFPPEFLRQAGICSITEALREVHQPTCNSRLAEARYRFVYQELLVMQLALAMRRRQLAERQRAISLPWDVRIDARIRRLFPFELTEDQLRVIEEIRADLSKTVPMNRLLQGDVGTGKTAVAAYAMLLAVAHGGQAVLVAPTEVLARQHFETLSQLLSRSQVRIQYLTGAVTGKRRAELVEAVAAGEIDLLIGTQAVILQELKFRRLALVIIDEQHKFGVVQRATLRQSDTDPHYLVMTATPIPRTVAMTIFGDLEVSLLRNSPPGRQPVHTYLGEENRREQWWEFFRRKLREGQQGFVVSPMVNDDGDEGTSAETALENLSNGELSDFRLDLLHGRMKPEDKLQVMDRFSAGHTQVLIATSVVEVGIDVPNANLMTIEHGERFGLSQLHQLRGRVGRGRFPGYVCVFASPTSEEAAKRLQAFAATRDGFELAEFDFQLRGPGELFGTRQHGMPPLLVADLRRDLDILQRARQDARVAIEQDPGLANPMWHRLRKMVLTRYGNALELADVG
jgi:ATP-dependent DNA helicase RecG